MIGGRIPYQVSAAGRASSGNLTHWNAGALQLQIDYTGVQYRAGWQHEKRTAIRRESMEASALETKAHELPIVETLERLCSTQSSLLISTTEAPSSLNSST